MGEADGPERPGGLGPELPPDPRLRTVKVLPGPGLKDPVLHELLSAIMWLRYALQAALDGRPVLARHLAEMAGESVTTTLVVAQAGEHGEEGAAVAAAALKKQQEAEKG